MGPVRSLLLAALPGAVATQPVTGPVAEREIGQLIAALGGSGCDFERNGRWYPAQRAQEHLRRKYEWLRERGRADTAEQFIELAGTRSSMSGRAYRVRCPGSEAVGAGEWLGARLLELRERPTPTPVEPR